MVINLSDIDIATACLSWWLFNYFLTQYFSLYRYNIRRVLYQVVSYDF